MLRRDYDEDLFKDSTMTFGEHLEELRAALFKSLLGLAVTFCLGLFIGNYVVTLIKEPLSIALTNYYQRQSENLVKAKLDELKKQGKAIPGNPSDLATFISREQLLADEAYIDPRQLLEQVKAVYPQFAQYLASQGKSEASQAAAPTAEKGAKSDASSAQKVATSANSFGDLTRQKMLQLFVWRPVETDARVRPTALNTQEAFSIYMKATILVGAVFAAPWIFYQIWSFIAAGLYPHEKHYVHVFLPFSLGLFLFGVCLAFFFVFRPVLDFLLSFNDWLGIDPDPRISEWLGFVLVLPLGFGIAFQLPLVMLFLERIGIFSLEAYLSYWRVAILIIFILAMVLTPSDPYSMLLMAIPLTFLFFGGMLLCRFMPRSKRGPFDEDPPRRRFAIQKT